MEVTVCDVQGFQIPVTENTMFVEEFIALKGLIDDRVRVSLENVQVEVKESPEIYEQV